MEILGGTICATRAATNIQSRRCIDFFVVSELLLEQGWTIQPIYGCNFATHIPVTLTIEARRCRHEVRRLGMPRKLPMKIPAGPRLQKAGVDWSSWQSCVDAEALDQYDETIMSKMVDDWYAGIEWELLELFDLERDGECDEFLGIGMRRSEVAGCSEGRFRNTPNCWGLLGQRINWVSKALHQVWRIGISFVLDADGSQGDALGIEAKADIIRRFGHRARALHKHWDNECARLYDKFIRWNDGDDKLVFQSAKEVTAGCLRFLADLVRRKHRKRPGWERLVNCSDSVMIIEARELMQRAQRVVDDIAKLRSRAHTKAVRQWARASTLKEAHRSTKTVESTARKTASANKGHMGEQTAQQAADRGRAEWARIRRSTDTDKSETVIRAVEGLFALGRRENDEDEILLCPMDPMTLRRASKTFGEGTEVGTDCLRPRHVAWLSDDAIKAMATMFNCIERLRRWPECIREVVEVALGKKAGGCRLVGLAATAYRIWSRVRYWDIRQVMENRIARPFLAAAPGMGVTRAVMDQAWGSEVAWSKDEVAATTIIDFKSFYEYITIAEIADGGKQFGMPASVATLTAHLYMGPRRIRVDGAHSERSYAQQSILAGCTWATLFVRLIVIRPIESLLRTAEQRAIGWSINISAIFYIDDGALTTRGRLDAVALLHVWATKLMLSWVRYVMRKRVAPGKLKCIASSRELKKRLKTGLMDTGCTLMLESDFLGTDYAAGGALRQRCAQTGRRAKARKRKGKVKWLRKAGGKAAEVAEGGLITSMIHGVQSTGISPALMRDLRRTRGAVSKVKAGGASLTAKLALGGPKNQDVDPMITHGDKPLFALAAKLWDEPQRCGDMVKVWRKYQDQWEDCDVTQCWKNVHGAAGAMRLHLERIGASWHKPYAVKLLGHEVSLVTTPPKLLSALAKEQARLFQDQVLLERLAIDRGWNLDRIRTIYSYGIDWDIIRDSLNSNNLSQAEKHALRIITHGAYWSHERRWRAQMLCTGTCLLCFENIGTDVHELYECEVLQHELLRQRLLGRIAKWLPEKFNEAGYAPLRAMGLPPRLTKWEPIEGSHTEGDISYGFDGDAFGDGSGFDQQHRDSRVAAWSLVRMTDGPAAEDDEQQVREQMRGLVTGWMPTVPRGELMAYQCFLRRAGPQSTFIGDCKHVVDAASFGVPERWASSNNINADLWRETLNLQRDHEALPHAVKIKAHRSRSAAAEDGGDGGGIRRWLGNRAADHQAKELARQACEQLGQGEQQAIHHEEMSMMLKHLAVSAAWQLKHGAAANVIRRKYVRTKTVTGTGDDQQHAIKPRVDGGWECSSCRGFAVSKQGLRNLFRKVCHDVETVQIHPSHTMSRLHGILWCTKCGCYTSRWPRELRSACGGRPASEAQQNVRARLERGLPPTTAGYLNKAMSTSAGTAGTAGTANRRSSSAPVGRYLRLPGGPLARHPRSTISGGDAVIDAIIVDEAGRRDAAGYDGMHDADAHGHQDGDGDHPLDDRLAHIRSSGISSCGRASIGQTLLQPVAVAPREESGQVRRRLRGKSTPPTPSLTQEAPGRQSLCVPTSASGWTRRLHGGPSTGVARCHRCGNNTTMRCRQCDRRLCLKCAKSMVWCDPPMQSESL